MDLVAVATPDMLAGHHTHTADGVVRPTQVNQVIVGQVPLTRYTDRENRVMFNCCLDSPMQCRHQPCGMNDECSTRKSCIDDSSIMKHDDKTSIANKEFMVNHVNYC